jgi:hypothetical protein
MSCGTTATSRCLRTGTGLEEVDIERFALDAVPVPSSVDNMALGDKTMARFCCLVSFEGDVESWLPEAASTLD